MLLLPSIKQWKGWSLPSKLTAISAYVGIPLAVISFLLSFIPSESINVEDLSIALVSKIPDHQLLEAKELEIQNLKSTLERLQESSGDKFKQQALKELNLGNKIKATELMEKSAQIRTENAAQDWIDIGNITKLYDLKKALNAYQKAIDLDPSNPMSWLSLGSILLQLGNDEKAMEACKQVLKLSKNDILFQAMGYNFKGAIYKERGNLNMACNYFDISLFLFKTGYENAEIEMDKALNSYDRILAIGKQIIIKNLWDSFLELKMEACAN